MEIGNAGEKWGDVAILFPTQVENTQAGERNIVPGNRGRQPYECFILGKHTARNGVAGISLPRRELQRC